MFLLEIKKVFFYSIFLFYCYQKAKHQKRSS